MNYLNISDVNLHNKKVLIREDFNVPIQDGMITNDARIIAALPTIKYALENNAKIILMSHLGRPTEGEFDPKYSLKPVKECLHNLLNQEIKFIENYSTKDIAEININPGEIALLENVRFFEGEQENSEELSQKLASLCDIFVMDAFATAHRKQSSTCGVAEFAKTACIGPLFYEEITALSKVIDNPEEPMVAVVGGAKVSTKLEVLDALSKKVNQLIVGGGIANTFIAASGLSIGNSLYEEDLLTTARNIMREVQSRGGNIPMPVDVVVAQELESHAEASIKPISKVDSSDMILDIGPDTRKNFCKYLTAAKTILWNGPIGVFEYEQFSMGTKDIGNAIAASDAFTIAGGGDTISAIDKFNLRDKISYISTAGGAFLEFVAGKEFPILTVLKQRALNNDEEKN